jgi:hypothetical protein
LTKQVKFNKYIDRCAFPVGWGANAAFGHGGPGEFNKKVISKQVDGFVVEYETGAKKEVRLNPHNVHTFFLPVKTREDIENLELPRANDPSKYSGIKEDIEWAKRQGEWTIGWINGFFSGVHYFFKGFDEFLTDFILDPDFAKALIEKTGQWNLEAAASLCEAGVDCIGSGFIYIVFTFVKPDIRRKSGL